MTKYLLDKSSRLYRIPPFRDSHMHFLRDGKPLTDDELPDMMDAYVRRGIFQVHDMGHKSRIGLRARELSMTELRVKTAIMAIYSRGGYGSFLGIGVENAGEIAKVIAEVTEAGADFIKVVNSGVVDIAGEGVTAGGFSPEALTLICREAAARGLVVSCHANGDDSIRSAVEAGTASIEHGFFISNATLRMMADKGVAWTPTAYALLSLGSSLPGERKKYVEDIVARHLESIGYAASTGVRLQVGTDSGSAGVEHGSSFTEELRLFRKAGLPPERIIEAACMDEDEIERGNYLIVGEDFIETGKIEEIKHVGGMPGPTACGPYKAAPAGS